MIIDEENLITNISMNMTQSGIRLMLRLNGELSKKALRSGLDAVQKILTTSPADTQTNLGGQVPLPQLVNEARSDVRVLPVKNAYITALGEHLAQAGIRFAVEAGETESYIHLEGKNADELAHAITKLERDYPTLLTDEPQPEQSDQEKEHTETVEQEGITNPEPELPEMDTTNAPAPAQPVEPTDHSEKNQPPQTAKPEKNTVVLDSKKAVRTEINRRAANHQPAPPAPAVRRQRSPQR